MSITLSLILIFFAQFGAVFALVMNSKLLRDDRWQLAMANSWLISITQFIFVWSVATSVTPFATFLCAALGGSLGCGASHLFYTKHIMRKD